MDGLIDISDEIFANVWIHVSSIAQLLVLSLSSLPTLWHHYWKMTLLSASCSNCLTFAIKNTTTNTNKAKLRKPPVKFSNNAKFLGQNGFNNAICLEVFSTPTKIYKDVPKQIWRWAPEFGTILNCFMRASLSLGLDVAAVLQCGADHMC